MAETHSRKLFVNLAVRDLKKSMDFFRKLGFEFNPKFTDDKAACMIISEEAFVMLLGEPKAVAAGGKHAMDPQDHGFMYGWSFYDLDDHHWEVLWMDPTVTS